MPRCRSRSTRPSVWGPDDGDERDADAVRRADNALNGIFFGPLFHGAYPDGFLDDTAHLTDHAFIQDGDLATISAPLDNLGVNNYFPARVRAAREGEDHHQPDAPVRRRHRHRPRARRSPRWAGSSPPRATGYHRAVGTRVGACRSTSPRTARRGDDTLSADGQVHDADRVAYLHGHLGAVADAIEGGTDVRGYFAWSLLDNFEWAYGYDKRFGIVHVDYDTQVRTVKDSGREYARILDAHHAH